MQVVSLGFGDEIIDVMPVPNSVAAGDSVVFVTTAGDITRHGIKNLLDQTGLHNSTKPFQCVKIQVNTVC